MDIKSKYSELIQGACNSSEHLEKYLKAFVLVAYSKTTEVASDENKLLEIETFINSKL